MARRVSSRVPVVALGRMVVVFAAAACLWPSATRAAEAVVTFEQLLAGTPVSDQYADAGGDQQGVEFGRDFNGRAAGSEPVVETVPAGHAQSGDKVAAIPAEREQGHSVAWAAFRFAKTVVRVHAGSASADTRATLTAFTAAGEVVGTETATLTAGEGYRTALEVRAPSGPTIRAFSIAAPPGSTGSRPPRLKIDDVSFDVPGPGVPEPPGTPQPPGPTPLEHVQTFEAVPVRGPFRLKARALNGLRRARPVRRGGSEETPTPPFEVEPCGPGTCGTPGLSEASHPTLSPKPRTSFTSCNDCIDPQIAASDSYLVGGFRDFLVFYDKSGNFLLEKQTTLEQIAGIEPEPLNNVPLCVFFKPLIADINENLNLPVTKKDANDNLIKVENGYGINCDAKTGGTRPQNWSWDKDGDKSITDADFYWPSDEFFDARVLWDEHLDRFVVAALVKNSNTVRHFDVAKCQGDPRPACLSDDVASARRAILAIAVSTTQDPRDGWNTYWTWNYPGQDECPNGACPYPGGADYLSMGLSRDHIVLEASIGDVAIPTDDPTHNRRGVTVVPKAALTSAGPGQQSKVAYQNAEPLMEPDGRALASSKGPFPVLQPAVQHAPDTFCTCSFFATQWIASDAYRAKPENQGTARHNVLLWVFQEIEDGKTAIFSMPIPVQEWHPIGGAVAPQKVHGDFGLGVSPTLDDTFKGINKVVYRDSNLYMTFDECGSRTEEAGCLNTVLRYLRVALAGVWDADGRLVALGTAKVVDRSFGTRNVLDPPGAVAWYSFPVLEANKDGDAVLAYHRSGDFLYPEARYSVYFKAEADIRGSRALKKGTYTLGDGGAAEWHHYAGMSVDPFDRTGIWMIMGYSKDSGGDSPQGIWRYAIGKVLGRRIPDLTAAITAFARPRPGRYRATVRIANGGDGAAPASVATVVLARSVRVGRARNLGLGRTRVPALASGRARTLRLSGRLPARARRRPHLLRVTVDATHRVPEYGERNNRATVPVDVRLPRR